MSRYTEKDALRAVGLLCRTLGKPYGTYVKNDKGDLVGNGGYGLEYNPVYGGCIIQEFSTDSTGTDTPFGPASLPFREFVQAVHMTVAGIELAKKRPKDRGIRLVFSTISGSLFSEIFVGNDTYPLEDFAYGPDKFESFSDLMSKIADQLGLHYDRTALDKWLEEEDPR